MAWIWRLSPSAPWALSVVVVSTLGSVIDVVIGIGWRMGGLHSHRSFGFKPPQHGGSTDTEGSQLCSLCGPSAWEGMSAELKKFTHVYMELPVLEPSFEL